MPFDSESGLVYKEQIVSVHQLDCTQGACRWIKTCVGMPPLIGEAHPRTRSLQDMALATIMRNLDLLNTECLATVPATILQRIWTAIRRARLDDIRVWAAFANLGLFDTSLDKIRLQQATCCPAHGMKVIIKEVNSSPMQWVVNLTLYTLKCKPVDLIDLKSLHNLRNLIIRADARQPVCLTDSVVREWSFAARDKDALSDLQMIFADGHPNLTEWSLQHLSHFKKLDTFCTLACGLRRRARHKAVYLGWFPGVKFMDFVKAQHRSRNLREDLTSKDQPWCETIRNYIVHRRGTTPDPLCNIPILDLSVDNIRRPRDVLDVHDRALLCLERQPATQRIKNIDQRIEVAHVDAIALATASFGKRRKIKSGKFVDLGNVLDL